MERFKSFYFLVRNMKNILICYNEHFDEIDAAKVVEKLKKTKPKNIVFHEMETSYPDIFGGSLREVLYDMFGSYESIPVSLIVESFLSLDSIIFKALDKIHYVRVSPQDYVRKLSEGLPKISKKSGIPITELKKMSFVDFYILCSYKLVPAEINELVDKKTGAILNVHQMPYSDEGRIILFHNPQSKILKRVSRYLDSSVVNYSEEIIPEREVNFKEYSVLELCAYKNRGKGYKNLLQFLGKVFNFLS